MSKAILAALTFVMAGAFAVEAHAEKDRYEVGEEVKNFTLKAINAEESGDPYVGINRFVGPDADMEKKAVVLSFFATYCEPCKQEMPFLAALYDHYRDKGLMVLLVTIDKEAEKIEEAKALAKEAHIKFPVLSDRFNIVAKRYYIEKLPCVYLVGADGKVAMVNVGYNDDISKNLLDNIRKAIGEPTTEPVPDALARFIGGHSAAAPGAAPPDANDAAAAEGSAAATGQAADEAVAGEPKPDQAEGKKKKKKKRRKRKRRKKKKR
jgi:alkyl hydroperoxide reductase subunit AhpC